MEDNHMAECPECGGVIEVDDFNELGEIITCCHCDASLRIIKLNPVKFRVIRSSEDEYIEDVNNNGDLYENYNMK